MPEGKLRSGVYRSFILCDDPRRVVECGAIKKQSKIHSTNQRFDHSSKPKERSETAPRKSTEDVPPSSLQLLRVSKGIRKLNIAVDSWSKGLRNEDVRSEDIAKNLLRGALDLEESLTMLTRIQEDAIKQKPRISKDGRGDLRFQRSLSDRFGERIEKQMLIQENVASKDCYEELRKMIKESFRRQNLLPQTKATGTKTRVIGSDFAFSSGAASSSTSSTQSSMISSSTKSSASSDIPRGAPNLIARLMGLDLSPQEPRKSTVDRIDDKPDILNLSVERREQLKKNNKKESPEIVRWNSTREPVLQSLPEEIPSENPSTIVLMRPMRVVQPEMEPKPGYKRPVLSGKPRMQGEVHPRAMNQRKDHQVMEVNKRSNNKMKLPSSLTKKDREPKEMVRIVEENEGKLIKILSPCNAKAVARKPKERVWKIKENEGKLIKLMSPSSAKAATREPKEMVWKVEENEGQLIKLISPSNAEAVKRERKPMETNKKLSVKKEDTGEGKERYIPHDQALKPPNNPVTNKKSKNSSDMPRNKSRGSRLSSSSSSSEQKSSSREKKSGEASRAKTKKKLHQQVNDLASENNSGFSQDTHGSINQISAEGTISSESHIQGHCDNGEVSSYAATNQHSDEPKPSQTSLESLLSSSSDFISYAENLFDFNTNTKRSRESDIQNRESIVFTDQRLALDFAKEVAKCRSILLLVEPTCSQRSSVHIDELLSEVCDGFESLRSYRDTFLGQNSFVKEMIHMVLEKDLENKKTEMTSGVWDLGWRSEFQIDETHQAIVDLEKLILSGLIQEIIS